MATGIRPSSTGETGLWPIGGLTAELPGAQMSAGVNRLHISGSDENPAITVTKCQAGRGSQPVPAGVDNVCSVGRAARVCRHVK